MNFTPKKEEDLPKFGPFPLGDYDGQVIEARDEVSSNNNEMIHLVLRFRNDEGRARTVHDYLLSSKEGTLRHFCVSCGLMAEYEAGTLSAADCMGQNVRAKLRVRKQDGFDDKNEVVDYLERSVASRPGPTSERQSTPARPANGVTPAARDQAKKLFLVPWNAFVGEFPAEAGKRDHYWSEAVKSYFDGKDIARLTDRDWSDFGAAVRNNWDPVKGWKKPAAVGPNAAPFGDEEHFKEDDIPF